MHYLTAEEVLAIHSEIIDRYGGAHGVRDLGLLESAAARPHAGFGKFEAYQTVWEKATVLFCSLIQNHAFVDGNKRTAVVSAGLFLERNGYTFTSSQEQIVDLALGVALKKVGQEMVTEFLKSHTEPR